MTTAAASIFTRARHLADQLTPADLVAIQGHPSYECARARAQAASAELCEAFLLEQPPKGDPPPPSAARSPTATSQPCS